VVPAESTIKITPVFHYRFLGLDHSVGHFV
jgi:hypothetical protein